VRSWGERIFFRAIQLLWHSEDTQGLPGFPSQRALLLTAIVDPAAMLGKRQNDLGGADEAMTTTAGRLVERDHLAHLTGQEVRAMVREQVPR